MKGAWTTPPLSSRLLSQCPPRVWQAEGATAGSQRLANDPLVAVSSGAAWEDAQNAAAAVP